MSTVVDQRVVSMEFDNKQFERNVQTSMSTIDKLKQALNFKGASKGLENLGEATKKNEIDFRNLEVTACQAGFSIRDAWIKMVSSIEYEIGSKMKNVIKMFTIDPIKTGLSEYETQLNSVQTILANTESKGSTLEDVNAALDELNKYADMTIYNFTEMTRNIGTFTAAGVELDTSVAAIKGIANLAAVSGSNAQQASTAMYQLSQALASGTVKLMDWNSVVNAGMGGQVFQDALKETARVHGIAIDEIIEKNGSFRESLKEGWLTSEILTETLSKFTGDLTEEQLKSMGYTEEQIKEIIKLGKTANDAATKVKTFSQLIDTLKEAAQSGWAQTFEIIIGDFEEAKELWTQVSDVVGGFISNMSDARNKLLSGALDSGWDKLLGTGIMDEEGYSYHIKRVAKEHNIAIDDMIAEHGSLEKALREGFRSGDISADILSEALNELSLVYGDLSEEGLKNLGYTEEQAKALMELNAQVQNGTISMEEFVEQMTRLSGRELVIESLKNIFQGLLSVIKPIKEAFTEIFPALESEQLYNALASFHEFTSKLKLTDEAAENLKKTFKGVFAAIDIVITILKPIVKFIGKILSLVVPIAGIILKVTGYLGEFISCIRDCIKGIDGFSDSTESLTDRFVGFLKNVIGGFGNFIDSILGAASFDSVKSVFESFLSIIQTVWSKISSILHKIGDLFGEVFGFIAAVVKKVCTYINDIFNNTFDSAAGESNGGATIFDLLSGFLAGGIGVGIFKLIKKIREAFEVFDDVKDAFLNSFQTIMSEMQKTMKTWRKSKTVEMLKDIAIALLELVAAIVILTLIPEDKLMSALAAIGILLGALTAVMVVLSKFQKTTILESGSIKDSLKNLFNPVKSLNDPTKNVTKIALAILILSFALTKLAKLEWDEIGRGLVAMGGTMVLLIAATAVLNKLDSKKALEGTDALKTLSNSLLVLAFAFIILGKLSWGNVIKGLTTMTIALTVMVGALAVMSKINTKDNLSNKGAKQLMIMVQTLLLLGVALHLIALLSWNGIAKGLVAITATMIILTSVLKAMGKMTASTDNLLGNRKGVKQLMEMTKVLLVLGAALHILALLSWKGIAKGLVAMTLSLTVLIGALAVMSKINTKNNLSTKGAVQLVIMASSLLILGVALRSLAAISWNSIIKSLIAMTLTLGILAGALAIISKIPFTAVGSMVAMAGSLIVLSIALAMMGSLKLTTIVTGLIGIAGAFAVLAIGFKLLQPVIFIMALFSASLLTIAGAVAIFAIGIGLAAVTLPAFAAALSVSMIVIAESIMVIGKSIISLIPFLIEAIGKALVALCVVIIDGATMIGKAVAAVILAVIDSLVTIIPSITRGLLEILLGVLTALTEYVPKIVDKLVEFICKILNVLTKRLPEIIEAVFGFIVELFKGVMNALQALDPKIVLQALLSVALMKILMKTLGGFAKLLPGALLGVLAISAVIAEIGLIIAAFGALAQIPGVTWIIQEGGKLLEAIGTAIGQFIGGFFGGIAKGFISSMPEMATNLSQFMENLYPFIIGLNLIDDQTVNSGKRLVELMAALIGTSFLNSLTAFFTGGTSLSRFAKELANFGKGLSDFASNVSGINPEEVKAASQAGVYLADMANKMPKRGGLAALFAGENNLDEFGDQLKSFGTGLMNFADTTSGLDPDSVLAASQAGVYLADMANKIPLTGGVAQWFAGEVKLGSFGEQIEIFGKGLKNFAESTEEINPKEVESASKAGVSLANMANKIPLTGGVKQWFTGEVDLGSFGDQVGKFGEGLKKFADSTLGINPKEIVAASTAGMSLAEMANKIPLTGGITSWFEGETDLGSFANNIKSFGIGLKSFANSTLGINPKEIVAASAAGMSLAEMANKIPLTGGIVSWWEGETDFGTFANNVKSFGIGLKSFATSIVGIDPTSVATAALAGMSLAEMANKIPLTGGVVSWFEGETDFLAFSNNVGQFGVALRAFSNNITGINASEIATAALAGMSLAEMANKIPLTGGVVSWFEGETDFLAFSNNVGQFGVALRAFSNNIVGINASEIATAALAGMSLAEMANKIPLTGGVKQWFDGENDFLAFSNNVGQFGVALRAFSNNITGINVSEIAAAALAGMSLAEMANKIPLTGGISSWWNGEADLGVFGDRVGKFGEGLKTFAYNTAGITVSHVAAAALAGMSLAEMANKIPLTGGIVSWFEGEADLGLFGDRVGKFGEGLKKFADNTAGITPETVKAAAEAGKTLGQMANSIPLTGGISSWWNGEADLGTFGERVGKFGEGLKTFADNTAGISVESMASAASSAKTFADIANILDDSKDGIKNLKDFGTNVADFGTKLKTFSDNSSGISIENVNAAVATGKSVSGMLTSLSNSGEAFTNSNKLSSFGNNLTSLGSSIRIFVSQMNSIGDVDQVSTSLEKLNDSINKFANTTLTSIGSELISFVSSTKSALANSVSELFQTAVDAAKAKIVDFVNVGKEMMVSFIQAVQAYAGQVKTAFSNVIGSAMSALKSKNLYSTAYSSGTYVVSGLTRGIWDSAPAAINAATTLANSINNAIQSAFLIESPSKVMYENGSYIVEGLTNSLYDHETDAYDAGYGIADNAKNGIQKAISKVSSIIENGIDTQPTIRPVLDLSDVNAGADSINSMFGMSPSVGVMSKINSINRSMNQNQNRGNADVISAIKDLSDKLENNNSSGNVYNLNGITYDDGSILQEAVKTIIRAAKIERRV